MKLVDKILWESIAIFSNSNSKNKTVTMPQENSTYPVSGTYSIALKSTNMKSVTGALQDKLLIKDI